MKKTVLIFLTDQYADWEASYVAAELQAPHSEFQVKTVTLDGKPVSSIGGFKVLPDYSLADTETIDFYMLILPGGNMWRQPETVPVKELIARCVSNNIPVAAICDATVFLGRYGFLDGMKHTSNSLENLKEGAPIMLERATISMHNQSEAVI